MATIPLLLEEDVEAGNLPSYEDVVNGKESISAPTQAAQRFLLTDIGKNASAMGAVAYANISIRLGFLRKVLGILTFQLLITAVFCVALYGTTEIREFVQNQPWIVFGSIIFSLVLLVAMFINAHSVPLNYILLVGWTIMQSITVGTVVSFFDVKVVIEAVGLTTLIVICLFVYTLQSKRDFQSHWAALFSISIIFLIASTAQLFISLPLYDLAVAVFGAILFSVYLVFDIDRIMHHISAEDYIEACVSIYLDIINLFLRILQILNEINRN